MLLRSSQITWTWWIWHMSSKIIRIRPLWKTTWIRRKMICKARYTTRSCRGLSAQDILKDRTVLSCSHSPKATPSRQFNKSTLAPTSNPAAWTAHRRIGPILIKERWFLKDLRWCRRMALKSQSYWHTRINSHILARKDRVLPWTTRLWKGAQPATAAQISTSARNHSSRARTPQLWRRPIWTNSEKPNSSKGRK